LVYDTQVKLGAYARAGVPAYAIIDPRAHTLDHYRLHSPGRYDGPRSFGETDVVSFDCLPPITLPIADLFAGAPDPTP
jgi:Uma2 family endonuclease